MIRIADVLLFLCSVVALNGYPVRKKDPNHGHFNGMSTFERNLYPRIPMSSAPRLLPGPGLYARSLPSRSYWYPSQAMYYDPDLNLGAPRSFGDGRDLPPQSRMLSQPRGGSVPRRRNYDYDEGVDAPSRRTFGLLAPLAAETFKFIDRDFGSGTARDVQLETELGSNTGHRGSYSLDTDYETSHYLDQIDDLHRKATIESIKNQAEIDRLRTQIYGYGTPKQTATNYYPSTYPGDMEQIRPAELQERLRLLQTRDARLSYNPSLKTMRQDSLHFVIG